MQIPQDKMKEIITQELSKLDPEIQERMAESLKKSEEQRKLNEERYGEVYHRLDRLLRLTWSDAPSVILANELCMLCELYSTVHPEINAQVDYVGFSSGGEV